MTVDEGVFDSLHILRLEVWSRNVGKDKLKAAKRSVSNNSNVALRNFCKLPAKDVMAAAQLNLDRNFIQLLYKYLYNNYQIANLAMDRVGPNSW